MAENGQPQVRTNGSHITGTAANGISGKTPQLPRAWLPRGTSKSISTSSPGLTLLRLVSGTTHDGKGRITAFMQTVSTRFMQAVK